jgi:hypothetical protein
MPTSLTEVIAASISRPVLSLLRTSISAPIGYKQFAVFPITNRDKDCGQLSRTVR